MSGIMDIGAASTIAYQRALSTISDNIANATVEGYARRTAVIGASSVNTLDPQFHDAGLSGYISVNAITRWQDDLKSDMARSATSEKSRLDTRLGWMRDVEAFTTANGGLTPFVTGLRDAVTALSVAPQAQDARTALLSQAEALAQAIVGQRNNLERAAAQVYLAAQNAVSALNDDVQNLARTNELLSRAPPNSSQWADQADIRDRLLDKISSLIDIKTTIDDKGCANLYLANDPTRILVNGSQATGFSIDAQMQLWHDPYGTATNCAAQQGRIAGLMQAAQYIAARISNMDQFAHSLADDFNAFSQQAINARGTTGLALFNLSSGALASALTLAPVTAEDIGIAAPWIVRTDGLNRGTGILSITIDNTSIDPNPLPSYEIYIASATIAEIIDPTSNNVMATLSLPMVGDVAGNGFAWRITGEVAVGDRFTIAPPGPNPSDIRALNAMQAWLEEGSAISGLQQEANDMAFATASTARMANAADTVAAHAQAAVENSRGVNIDEETIALQELQKAYAAAARILQMAQDIFDSIIRVR